MNISTPAEYVHMLEQITRLVFALLTFDRHFDWLATLRIIECLFFRNMLSLSLLLRSFPFTGRIQYTYVSDRSEFRMTALCSIYEPTKKSKTKQKKTLRNDAKHLP